MKVKLNKSGQMLVRKSRRQRIEGIVISPASQDKVVAVLWNGATKAEEWHVDFLQIEQERRI